MLYIDVKDKTKILNKKDKNISFRYFNKIIHRLYNSFS